MENVTNQNYGQENPNFRQEPKTADFEILASGANGSHDFQNEEFIDDSPNRHPEQDRNPDYPLRSDYDEDEETEPDDDDDDDENGEEELDNKYDLHPEQDIFDQDLLNPFTTDTGL